MAKFYRKTKEDPVVYQDPEYTKPIGSEEEFKTLGGIPDWPASWKPAGLASNIVVSSPEFKPKIPDQIGVDTISEAITAPIDLPPDVLGPGEIVSVPGAAEVFKFTGKGLQHIPTAEALEAEFGKEGWAKIKPVKQKTLDYWLEKKPAIGELLRPEGRPEVFKYEGVEKGMRWITDPGVFEGMEYKWEDVRDVLPTVIEGFKRGEPISALISEKMPYGDLKQFTEVEAGIPSLEETRDKYVEDIKTSLEGIGELREEERKKAYEEFEVKTSKDLLDQVNVEVAEKETNWALAEENIWNTPAAMPFIKGNVAHLRRQAAIEMGGLYSKQEALGGNYDRAIELADKSIGWAIEDEKLKIEALKFVLDSVYDKLSSEEQEAVNEFNYELTRRERELDREEDMKSWKRDVMVAYPLAGIKPTDSEVEVSKKLQRIAEIQSIADAEEWHTDKFGNTTIEIDGEKLDLHTTAGAMRAYEMGATYGDLRNFLSMNAKGPAGTLTNEDIEMFLADAGVPKPPDIQAIEQEVKDKIGSYADLWSDTANKKGIIEANKSHGTIDELSYDLGIEFPELSEERINAFVEVALVKKKAQEPGLWERFWDKVYFWD